MKKFYFTSVLFSLFFVAKISFGQPYCIPPESTYGYGCMTGIKNVAVGTLNNSSSALDGYTDYTSSVDAPVFIIGETYTYDMTLHSTITTGGFSGNLDARVWIDWNQDFEFDSTEMVGTWSDIFHTDSFTTEITIPANAKVGSTRMRVYNDMPSYEGHDPPIPCGYLNSTNALGQHGECEDYKITIDSFSTNIDKPNFASILKYYPNPTNDYIFIDLGSQKEFVTIDVKNVLGVSVLNDKLTNKQIIEMRLSDLHCGIYIVEIRSKNINSFIKVIKE